MLNIYHFLHFSFLTFLHYKMYNVIHLNCFYFFILAFSSCIIFLIRNVEMFNIWLSSLLSAPRIFCFSRTRARGQGNARGFAALFNSRPPIAWMKTNSATVSESLSVSWDLRLVTPLF